MISEELKLLVIEDNELVAKMIKRVLGRCWKSITLATSSDEGIEFLKDGSYDVVLSDWDCPGPASGHRVVQATQLPIVILTGNHTVDCPEASAIAYKPVDMEILQDVLVTAFEKGERNVKGKEG